MGLEKTSYNLIYNTDGSLCTTIREDDVPFEGVKSFAVEVGAENLANPDLTTWAVEGNASLEVLSETYMSYPIYRIASDPDAFYKGVYYLSSFNTGDLVTLSLYVRAYETDKLLYYFVGTEGNITIPDDGQFHRITITETVQGTVVELRTLSGQKIDVCMVQVEQKPFATSFVDGTRPSGKIRFPVTLPEQFVLLYWAKMTYKPANSYYYLTIVDYLDTQNWAYSFQIRYNYPSSGNWYLLTSTRNAGTLDILNGVISGDITNQWGLVVWTYDGAIIRGYYNGQKILENAFTYHREHIQNKLTINDFDFYPSEPKNGLISNLIIGEYDPNLWTDEYIQELYNARKPFSVPEGAKFI